MVQLMSKDMFDEMFGIMQQSFPADEYRKREKQLALFDDESYKVYYSAAEDGKIAAFIAAWKCGGINFLEHFAVRSDLRGAGLGGAFLDEVIKTWKGAICLEVEPPENEICKRRIAFYRRHSFFVNDFDYVQPPLSDGAQPKKLLLMTHSATASEKQLREIARAIHFTAYKTDKYL